jgi:hypothetical protein
MDFRWIANDGYALFIVLALAIIAGVYLARAAVQRKGVAVALRRWMLAALVVPFASIFLVLAIHAAVNARVDGTIYFVVTFMLAVVNSILYWVSYAIFRALQAAKSGSIARLKDD